MSVSKKLVCIGDGACGKTSLLIMFANNEFNEDYVPTVFENYVAAVETEDGTVVDLALWDTAGQEDYAHIRPLSYQQASVFLVCFAVDSPDSFDNVKAKWHPEIMYYSPKSPYLIIGCKGDLRESAGRTVKVADAERMSEELDAVRYMECSAKGNVGVKEVFLAATAAALASKTSQGCKCALL